MEHTERPRQADRPIPELLRQLAGDTATLVRQELQLARSETVQRLKQFQPAAIAGGAAASLALGAFGALTATLIALLSEAMAVWVAALIVTVVYAVAAWVAVSRARSVIADAASPVPEQTVESVRRDVDAVRAGVQRGR
jgi:hypothetical protein